MSNHYYIVLRVDTVNLFEEEIADRWLKVCPRRKVNNRTADVKIPRETALFNDESRLVVTRSRLNSLSST